MEGLNKNLTFILLVKILLNVVLIAISIDIVSFISGIIDNKFKSYKYFRYGSIRRRS